MVESVTVGESITVVFIAKSVTPVCMCACVCVCWRTEVRAAQRLIVKPPSDVRAVKGDDVTLECAADGGRRSPRLTWKRRSGTALPHNRYSITLGMCVPVSDCWLSSRYVSHSLLLHPNLPVSVRQARICLPRVRCL